MIADSSVWIGYLRGARDRETLYLKRSVEREEPIYLVAPVFQEVLQGANGVEQFARWDGVLGQLPLLVPDDTRAAARDAAALYVRCRAAGLTIRSPNDCLIAAIAIEFDLPLLQRDRDFTFIARVEPHLKLHLQ